MKDWRGSSKSTSEFVSHFIAQGNNGSNSTTTCDDDIMTVEEAILSVLSPRDDGKSQEDFVEQQKQREDLLMMDNNYISKHLDAGFRHDSRHFGLHRQLRPVELLALGSIWYLPEDAPRDPGLGVKPMRLEAKHLTCTLKPGDYLRVHHTPRRFPEVHNVDWSKIVNESNFKESHPGVIVHEDVDKGYMVINKPAGVPVHPTVDNILENVVSAVGRAILARMNFNSTIYNSTDCNESLAVDNKLTSWKYQKGNHQQKKKNKEVDPLIYVATPQRLDHNTSGLFVVATKKEFAAYFAKLLRVKTEAHLRTGASNKTSSEIVGNVHKRYRCLVCIQHGSGKNENGIPVSLGEEVERLQQFASDKAIIRHWLEPNFRAPHVFSEEYSKDWLECLLRITRVGKVIPVDDSCELSKLLWRSDKAKMPPRCKAIAELEVELMTGRAHQIRGQLSAMGFPICGDAVYGGIACCENTSPPQQHTETRIIEEQNKRYTNSEQLALQCCELQFPDVDYSINKKGDIVSVPSERFNKFRLETAWWTPFLSEDHGSFSSMTTNLDDLSVASTMRRRSSSNESNNKQEKNHDKDIPTVQLSVGANKYVIIKATSSGSKEVKWFVKSATPEECGGPYHADVARGLLKDLSSANYDTVVCGGGRINYDAVNNVAHVYGFSYGFGKGDHEYVSLLIENEGINATYDDSDVLY